MKTIKPSDIKQVLDLTLKIREQGGLYIPCFSGDAGVGKSENAQTWAKSQGPDFNFIDIRLAYMEGPDLIGMPSSVVVNGQQTTIHSLPDFLPREGRGLILFEEPNRAHESTMNAMMQILTDRKIHKYSLPEGYIIAAAINPEGKYTVNSLDPALKNRFAMFNVTYSHLDFVNYIRTTGWDARLINFIDKFWVYKFPNELSEDAFYVSPRSLKQVNSLLKAGAEKLSLFAEMLTASMGSEVSSDFLKFLNDYKPVTLEDLLTNETLALSELKKLSENKEYKGDLLSMTVNSVQDGFIKGLVDERLLLNVVKVLTIDQSINLLVSVSSYINDLETFIGKNSDILDQVKRRQSGEIKGVA